MTRAEYNKQYRKKNAEKLKEYRKTYYEKNREKLLADNKKLREDNPELYRQRAKEAGARRRNNPNNFIDLMFRAMVDRSRKKGMEITVDRAYLTKLMEKSNGRCALSGMELTLTRNMPNLASPDRKNSNKGYVKGNIQIVAACVNVAKNKMTTKQFIAMCKAVAENNDEDSNKTKKTKGSNSKGSKITQV